MAFEILGATTVDTVQGGTRILKMREWSAQELPSETYFQFLEPFEVTKDGASLRADEIAQVITQLLARPDITDVVYSQDVTPGGRLLSLFTIYWQTTDGASSGFVEATYPNFTPAYVEGAIANDIAAVG